MYPVSVGPASGVVKVFKPVWGYLTRAGQSFGRCADQHGGLCTRMEMRTHDIALFFGTAALAALAVLGAANGGSVTLGEPEIRIQDVSSGTDEIKRIYGAHRNSWSRGGPDNETGLFHVETNSHGLREYPFNVEKPSNTTRILFLGDSFTFGHGVNESQRYTDIVERRLNRSLSRNVQAINAGVGGYGMRDYYTFLKLRGLSYQPDTIVVTFQYDDVLDTGRRQRARQLVNRTVPADPEGRNRSEVVKDRMHRIYTRFFREIDWWDSDIPVYGNRIRELAQEHGIPVIFFKYYDTGSARHREQIREWVDRDNIRYVPPPPEFDEHPRASYTYLDDGHYNPTGHRYLADQLTPVLRKRLR